MDNFPLLELFTRLREAGLPLGIDDYQTVLKSLQAGFGLEDKAALGRLCRTVWIKSKQDKTIFDYHFEQIIIQANESINHERIVDSVPLVSKTTGSDNKKGDKSRNPGYFILLFDYLVPVSILSLICGIGLRIWRSNYVPVFISQPRIYITQGESYQYDIEVRDFNKNDKLTIEAVRCPSWLTFKDNEDETAILSGIEGNPVDNSTCLSPDGSSDRVLNSSEDLPKNQPESYSVELRVTDNHGATSRQTFIIKVGRESLSIWWMLLFLLLLFVVVYYNANLTRRESIEDRDEKDKTKTDDKPSETLPKIDEEKKVTEYQQQTSQLEKVKPLKGFIQITEYPPVTRRQMKQNWRYLRRMLREGVPTELDVEATVERISREGVLLEPAIAPRRINRTKLLLLIDQDGSMIPFKNVSHQLAETAIRGGRLEQTDIYYFHNCPMDYLYQDRYYQMAKKIEDVFTCLNSHYASLLVFSDAGAARGGFNPERLEVTAEFLKQLRQQVRHFAWLNPMPRDHWFGTTADKISQLVPMFELSRQGLYNAIAVLRGHGDFGT